MSSSIQPLAPLRPGDRIALVAPSSPFAVERFDEACGMLEDEGYQVARGKHLFARNGYLAGTEEERARDLVEAIEDPAVAAIFCMRGGYGSGRLLPGLPFATLRRKPKIFLGYSDVTFLHLAFRSRMQWVTFHGPNFVADMAEDAGRLGRVLGSLREGAGFAWDLGNARVIRPGSATGPVIGGNLTCMAHLLGTPYFPDPRGAILLIEDRGEAVYRIDRMITHLELAGVLPALGGLVLGNFDGCGSPREIWDMVAGQTEPYDFPVVAGLPFGHGCENHVLPLGVPFRLDIYESVFKALQHPFAA